MPLNLIENKYRIIIKTATSDPNLDSFVFFLFFLCFLARLSGASTQNSKVSQGQA